MSSPNPNPTVLSALDKALAELKEKNANPLANSPLWPYREKIAALLSEQANNAQIAELFTKAGLPVSATIVARFVRDAKLKKKRRSRRDTAAAPSAK